MNPAFRLSIAIAIAIATRLFSGALVFGILLAFPSHARQVDRAAELTQELADRYDAIDGMRMRFVQTASSAFMDEDERYSGMLTFTDRAYHIQTSNQTIVTDGTTTWVHNRGERQVIVNDFVEDETAFSLTDFLRSFSDEYDATFEGSTTLSGQRHNRLRLHPRDDFASFRQVDLWIRASDGLVTRLIAVDLNDVRMEFDLSDIEVNPDISLDLFQFDIQEGVEVVDLREND